MASRQKRTRVQVAGKRLNIIDVNRGGILMNDQLMLEAAKQYIEMELPIIPLCCHNHQGMSNQHKERCKSPGKSPILKQWTKHTYTDEEQLQEWFNKNPHINIGLVLGQTDCWNLVGIDIDGDLGEQMWEELCRTSEVPETWEFYTGNGRRLLFKLPDGLRTKKHKVCWKEGHEELAFLAKGQQTVLPPSIHPSGKRYSWRPEHSPFDLDIAMAPSWIQERISAPSGTSGPETIPNFYGETLSRPVTVHEFSQDVYEGSRSDHLARFVGSLCAKRELPKETIIATAMQQNLLHCKPPLSEAEVIAMVESVWQSEQQKHEERLARQRRRQELHPAVLTELFFKTELEKGVHWRYSSDRQKFYRTTTEQGPWVQQSDEQVEAYVQEFLLQQDPVLGTSSKRSELIKALRLYIMNHYGDGREFDIGRYPNLKYIALPNGLLDWQKGELIPWDPKFKHTTMIAATWNPDCVNSEPAKVWQDALHSWLPDEQTIRFLQEYIGYALLPSCKMRTAVFLYGEGANGKSLFIDVILKLFQYSYTVAQPQTLAHRFGTTSLIDKLLIVCSDIDTSYLDRTGVLKQIIAGDEIRAEYKGGKDFGFVPIGKMLFSANKLPKSADRSYGWYSRLQFVPFPNRFSPNQEYYRKLMKTMDSEEGRSVLLAWAVEGLQRLVKQGKFTISQPMCEAKGEYMKENDSVLAFAEELLESIPVDGGYKTALIVKGVYLTYRDWCEDSGVKPVSQSEFTTRIQLAGYEKKPLRWKEASGWKTRISLQRVKFKEDTEFDAYRAYNAYTAIALAK